MIKSIEITGKTEDEALASALAQLGLDRDDVSVEVVERAKSGFLGIGSSPAKLRVSYEAAEEEIAEEIPAPAQKASEKEPEPEKPVAAPSSAESVDMSAAAAHTEEFLKGLLSNMGSNAVPVLTINEDGNIIVNLTGDNLGSLIGRRGETLDAIQHLANYTINRGGGKRIRISVDAENYRQKREEALCRLAEKVAGKVIKYRKNITLEPMNSYERHVIHTALQNYRGVTTYSMDTEPNRRVVVAYDRANAPRSSSHSGGRSGSRRPSGSNSNSYNKPTSSAPTTPTESKVREWC